MKLCKTIFLLLSNALGRLRQSNESSAKSQLDSEIQPDAEVQDEEAISTSFSTFVQLNSSNL